MNRRLNLLVASLCLGLASFSAARGQLVPDGTYEITPESSSLALTAGGVINGSSIKQQAYTGAAAQRWSVTNLGSNVVEIVELNTSEALEVPGSSTTAGTALDTGSYTGASNQKWTLVSEGGGYYEVVNVNSNLEANVSGGGTSPGSNIIQWSLGNGSSSVWAFSPVSAGTTGSNAISFNLETLASGANSAAFNDDTVAGAYDSLALGRFNIGAYATGGDTSWISGDPLLEAGNGTDATHLSDAFILYKNGNAAFQGSVRVAPGGDLSMGSFTAGTHP